MIQMSMRPAAGNAMRRYAAEEWIGYQARA